MSDLTPMAKQYQEIKALHEDAILFFRLGDFYEMFNEDAELASRELDLTLTGRGKDENRMPMCGIPYHAADSYIAKLIEKGYKVAICEQTEDPALAQGLVKREVIRIITPGTVIDAAMLPENKNNYLLAINKEKDCFGLAWVDFSTGEFQLADFPSSRQAAEEIKRINPAEIIFSDMLSEEDKKELIPLAAATEFKDIYDNESSQIILKQQFKIHSLEAFGLQGKEVALGAAAAIIEYLQTTQKSQLGHIARLKIYHPGNYMLLDHVTRRNLELIQTARDKTLIGSLLWVIDKTVTAMGSRLLRQWIIQPLLDLGRIEVRLNGVEQLKNDSLLRADLAKQLKAISDIERLTARVATQNANARDLIAMKESLSVLPLIRASIKNCHSYLLRQLLETDNSFETEIIKIISGAIIDQAPITLKDGHIIKQGFSSELDELKQASRGGKSWIAELESQQRKRSGIKSLKVGFTKVFGYYIEVTNSNLDQVPADYIRKQTLVNAERFITPELKEKEALILNAEEKMKELEYDLFCQVRDQVAAFSNGLQQMAAALAQLDVLLALAQSAEENHYIRPFFNQLAEIKIIQGRHPVIEKTLGEFNFVANDVELDRNRNFLLITGPNMGGKSTYMRQIALISLLAQIGSFVPAREANLCLIDRIFTRIGAMDDIYSGQSTFMLEMTETANILNNATQDSLIILDEIGRGTATFDGMSIAAAVAEFIHQKIGAKTLFATHYHEITQLADKFPGMRNMNVLVEEIGDQIIFLHKMAEGPADRSYGIQVAGLAGLPAEVIKRAKEVYSTLEMVESDMGKRKIEHKGRPRLSTIDRDQASLF